MAERLLRLDPRSMRMIDIRYLLRDAAAHIVGLQAENARLRASLLLTAAPEPAAAEAPGQKPVAIIYTNWRGETAERLIIPGAVWFGTTNWHPDPQWLLRAFDVEKQADRDFAPKELGAAPVTHANAEAPGLEKAAKWHDGIAAQQENPRHRGSLIKSAMRHRKYASALRSLASDVLKGEAERRDSQEAALPGGPA
ncbi:hypothetical protein [Kaistia sp. 32K]|uniref:hypothetical protein n=1 Tax=Kaistia sp. 32K TaxID=2795690 RepID=UPI00191660A8|nr:hypothetical protein [Kaistia sp. 32K]